MNRTALDQAIKSLLQLLDAETVLSRIGYRTNSVLQNGSMLRALCPIHKETLIRSLNIDTTQRSFRCGFAKCAGSKGGNLFDLYVLATGKSQEEALREWSEYLGVNLAADLEKPDEAEKDKAEAAAPETPSVQKEQPETEPAIYDVEEGSKSTSPTAETTPDVETPTPEAEDGQVTVSETGETAEEEATPGPDEQQMSSDEGSAEPKQKPALPEETPAQPGTQSALFGDLPPEISGLSDAIDGLDDEVSSADGSSVLSAMTGSFAETLSEAISRLEAGAVDEALELGADCFRLAVTDVERAQSHLLMGRAQYESHRYAQSLRELRSGLEPVTLPPEVERELRYHLALVLEARKDFRSAYLTLKRAVDEQGHFRDTDAVLRRLEKATENLPSTGSRKRIAFV